MTDPILLRRRRMVAGLTLVALIASTGLGVAINLTADGTPTVVPRDPFELVDPIGPTNGEIETSIRAARISSDGTLQLVIEGSDCSVFTWAQTTETQDAAQVRAFIWSDEELCPAAAVPWLVEIRLESALSTRQLLVGSNAKPVDVIDCRAIAAADICRVGGTSAL